MGLLTALGFHGPVVIPRPEVTREEVQRTLASRLLSRYTVMADSEHDLINIQVHAKRPGKDRHHRSVTVQVVPSGFSTDIKVRPASGSVLSHVRRFRRLLRSAPELRVGKIERTTNEKGEIPDGLVSLLSLYGGQFGSYTTLLWQVPALGLTAQSFLLTIALAKDTSSGARIVACVLSVIIAIASASLMHNQRGRAINHAELLRRLSEKAGLNEVLHGSVELGDAVPKKTNAQNIWAVDHLMYQGWVGCMALFGVADVLIISAVGLRPSLFG